MAQKTYKKPGPKSAKEQKEDLLATARKQLSDALATDQSNRDRVLEELRFAFVPGEQWDDQAKTDREGRLCLEFNQLPSFVDQVTGSARRNKHSGKVHPESEDADIKIAELIEGWIRRVESRSHASIAYDTGREHAVTGWGYWRVRTDYEHDRTFNQTVFIDPIYNRFSVVFGYSEAWHRQDAEHCFVLSTMNKKVFEQKYPKAVLASFDESTLQEMWYPADDRVTLAEYFCKEHYQKKIYQLPDGQVVDELPEELKDQWPEMMASGEGRERPVDSYKIYRYLLSGHEILEDRKHWPSKFWPIVPVDGKITNINGEILRTGVVTYAIDHQKSLNFLLTTDVETAAFSPKNPWVIEARQIANFEQFWKTAHKMPYPYLPYHDVPNVPKPTREEPISGAPTLLISANAHRDGLRITTGGVGISSLDPVEEKSGVAIARREAIGQTGNFAYPDNADRSIKLTWEIVIDLIPTILDTNRQIQVEDVNGIIKNMEINKRVPVSMGSDEMQVLNDLSKGRYGVTITTGPTFETQRQETSQTLMDLTKLYPQSAPVLAPTIVKNLDFPGSQEAARKMLVLASQVVPQTLSEDEKKEVQEYMGPQQPPAPDPKLLEAQAKIQDMDERRQMDLAKLRLEMEEIESRIERNRAESVKALALAEGVEPGQQMEEYKLQLETLKAKHQAELQERQMELQAQQMPPGGPQAPQGEPQMAGPGNEPQVNPEEQEGASMAPGSEI